MSRSAILQCSITSSLHYTYYLHLERNIYLIFFLSTIRRAMSVLYAQYVVGLVGFSSHLNFLKVIHHTLLTITITTIPNPMPTIFFLVLSCLCLPWAVLLKWVVGSVCVCVGEEWQAMYTHTHTSKSRTCYILYLYKRVLNGWVEWRSQDDDDTYHFAPHESNENWTRQAKRMKLMCRQRTRYIMMK